MCGVLGCAVVVVVLNFVFVGSACGLPRSKRLFCLCCFVVCVYFHFTYFVSDFFLFVRCVLFFVVVCCVCIFSYDYMMFVLCVFMCFVYFVCVVLAV